MVMSTQTEEQINEREEQMARPRKKLTVLTCKRCGHQWAPRTKSPIVCPSCHSPYWNKPVSTTKRRRRKK
jgi:rubrerythrin